MCIQRSDLTYHDLAALRSNETTCSDSQVTCGSDNKTYCLDSGSCPVNDVSFVTDSVDSTDSLTVSTYSTYNLTVDTLGSSNPIVKIYGGLSAPCGDSS